MLRIVNLVLVLTILTAQSAWAMNGAALYESESEQVYMQVDDQHDSAAETCSHFCHASAHLVGIFSNISFDILIASSRHTSKLINFAPSINYQPPTPPPTF